MTKIHGKFMSKWGDFLALLAEQGKRIFTTKEAQEIAGKLDISQSYLPTMLNRLKSEGWIEVLRKGVYVLGKGFGFAPLHEFEIAMHLTAPAAISHRSALSYYGLTDQIPRTVYVLTTPEHPTPRKGPSANQFTIFGVPYEFIEVKQERFFGLQEEWVGSTKVVFTDPERTLVDGLARPQYCGGFDEVRHGYGLYKDKIDLPRIIEYSLRLEGSIVKRLGWMLEKIGFSDEQLLPLIRRQSAGFARLDPSRPLRGSHHPVWRIRENVYGD